MPSGLESTWIQLEMEREGWTGIRVRRVDIFLGLSPSPLRIAEAPGMRRRRVDRCHA